MTGKTVQAELELKKGFADFQAKIQMTAQMIKVTDAQIAALKREQGLSELTRKEIGALDPKTPTYEAVGRLFVCRDMSTMKHRLSEKIEIAEAKVKKLEASKVTMENNVKESENNMREMVQQWKNQ